MFDLEIVAFHWLTTHHAKSFTANTLAAWANSPSTRAQSVRASRFNCATPGVLDAGVPSLLDQHLSHNEEVVSSPVHTRTLGRKSGEIELLRASELVLRYLGLKAMTR